MVRYIWGIEMIIKEIREIIKWVYNNLSCFQNGNDSEYYQGRKRGGAKNKGEKESEMISHEIFFLWRIERIGRKGKTCEKGIWNHGGPNFDRIIWFLAMIINCFTHYMNYSPIDIIRDIIRIGSRTALSISLTSIRLI